jgi:hypothetical protein
MLSFASATALGPNREGAKRVTTFIRERLERHERLEKLEMPKIKRFLLVDR